MSSKKRKTSFADNDDDDDDTMLQDDVSSPPSSVISKRSRKTAVRPSSSSADAFTGNPDFVRLKQQLYHAALEELGHTYQAAFAVRPHNNNKQLGTLTRDNRHPEFCRQVFVDYYWQLQALKELYHPYDTSSSHNDVVVFGQEDSGQTGIIKYIYQQKPGGVKPQILPELVKARVILVAGGGMHSAALTDHGVALTWGSNDEGQLGRTVVGESDVDVELSYTTPTAVTGLVPSQHAVSRHFVRSSATEERDVIRVAVGNAHTLFLTLSGNVYMTGSYKHPDGSEFIRDVPPPDHPHKDKGVGPEGRNFYPVHCYQLPGRAKYICAGGACSAAILEDDTLYTWGLGTEGQLARSATMTTETVEIEVAERTMSVPNLGKGFLTMDDPLTERPTVNVPVVQEHFVKPKPVLFEGISHKMMVGHVALGITHLLVTAKGPADSIYRAYSSGNGAYGKTGHGQQDERHALTLIEALKDEPIARVAAGENHSIFLNATGSKVYTCGKATDSQVGLDPQVVAAGPGGEHMVVTPTAVAFPSNGPLLDEIGRFVGIAAGENHSFAWTSCGKLYSWGLGAYGQIGNDPQDEADEKFITPKLISDEWFAKKKGGQPKVVVHNAAGGCQHSLVVASRFKP